MIQFTEEQTKLYDELKKETNPKRIAEIRKRLAEIAHEVDEKYKGCPFVH